jgi:purine-binding chemotaxis protein CheW
MLDQTSDTQLSGQTLHIVTFALDGEEYGVEIGQVQEINRMVTITGVPRTPYFVEGVINLRGRLIPIIDLRSRFGLKRCEHDKQTRIVVTELAGRRVGMVVDSVSEVLRIPVENVEAAPELVVSAETHYIRGVGSVGDRLIILIDLGNVVSKSEQQQLAQIAA